MTATRVRRGRTRAAGAVAAALGLALLGSPAPAGADVPDALPDRSRWPVDGVVEAVGRLPWLAPVDLQVPAVQSVASRISDSGVVIGTAWIGDGSLTRGFRWQDGRALLLPDLGFGSEAVDVNEAGQVAGTVHDGSRSVLCLWEPDGTLVELVRDLAPGTRVRDLDDDGRIALDWQHEAGGPTHAAVWHDGALTFLDDGGHESEVAPERAFDDHGGVAGLIRTSEVARAVVWRDGVATSLPVPEGTNSVALAVNGDGEVLGRLITSAVMSYAVVWDADGMRYVAPPEQWRQEFHHLTDDGVAVGTADTASRQAWRAAVSDASGFTLLPTLGGPYGEAFDATSRDLVVGRSDRTGGRRFDATAWVHGVPVPLGPSLGGRPSSSSTAVDVNARAQVVGVVVGAQGQDAGRSHAVLWDPVRRR